MTLRAAWMSATAYITGMSSECSQASTGIVASVTVRPMLATIISGRLRIRSAITPKNRLGPQYAASPAAVSRPTWPALACR
jgi:hypothetical protein